MKKSAFQKGVGVLLVLLLAGGGYLLGVSRHEKNFPLKLEGSVQASPKPGSARSGVVVDVARKVSPSIVTVGTTMLVRGRSPLDVFGSGVFRSFNLGPVEEGYFPYVGSGFIVDQKSLLAPGQKAKDGGADTLYVLTNYHVVENAGRIFVTLTDGREFEAKLLDADAVVDVALLQLATKGEKTPIPTIKLGDSDDIMVGESVIALGNPFGPIIEDPHPTVTAGVVSAVNRSFQPEINPQSRSARIYHNMIQTDAAVNPGNSGGPLVNMDGEVIGINTFILSPGGDQGAGSAGVNFSIPINRAVKVAREIIQYGKVRSLYLDFDVGQVTKSLAARYRLKENRGVIVLDITAKGPAEKAGLRRGDIILQVAGRNTDTPDDLLANFYSRTVGEKLTMTVSRDGKRREVEYEIQEGPGK